MTPILPLIIPVINYYPDRNLYKIFLEYSVIKAKVKYMSRPQGY